MSEPENIDSTGPRRGFLYHLAAGLAAAVAVLGPLGVGIAAFLDPVVRSKKKKGDFIRVASLDAVPPDGKPYRFAVITDRNDAWTHHPPEPIGTVYLRRDSDSAPPVAISSICPHLGCGVHWDTSADNFLCPCHNSEFKIDGAIADPASSPSPRGLDHLAVELRGNDIWVNYLTFKVGVADQIEV